MEQPTRVERLDVSGHQRDGNAAIEPTNEATFQDLWSTHGAELFRRCLRWMSGRVEHAEEAFSRAGMQAFEKYPGHRHGLIHPHRWLVRLTHNVCMDLHRELRRERACQVLDPEVVEAAPAPGLSVDLANPERRALGAELEAVVLASVRALSPPLREVAESVLLGGASYERTADRLGVSRVSLRKRVQQVRVTLRRQLAAYAAGSPRALRPPTPRRKARKTVRLHPWSVAAPVRLEPVQVHLASGLERDSVVPLHDIPQRPSSSRLASLRRYVERYPTGWKRRLELARTLVLLGQCSEAVAHYALVLERQPGRASLWIELAGLLESLGRNVESVDALARAHRLARLEPSERHLEGWIAGQAGDLEKAARALLDATALEPRNDAHFLALGRVLLRSGRGAEAVRAFDQALEVDPENVVALTLSHQALHMADRPREAAHRIQRAVALDDSNVLALESLVAYRTRAHEIDGERGRETRRLLRMLEARIPRRAATQHCLATFHLARGETERAERGWAAYLGEHPRSAAAWTFYARLLDSIGDTDRASLARRRASVLNGLPPGQAPRLRERSGHHRCEKARRACAPFAIDAVDAGTPAPRAGSH